MKKVYRKTMSLAFEPVTSDDQSYEVSTGNQKLGRVSYVQYGDTICVTNIEIQPYLEGFDIPARILDALLSNDEVKHIEVIAPLFMTGYYEESGFKSNSCFRLR